MSHIFISYSRKDLDFAKRIVQALKENSLDVWIDWMSIWKGEEWKPAIFRGIEEADAFLFLISPDSVISKICGEEISHALKNGKLIIPIVVRDTEQKLIREELKKLNWIFCRYRVVDQEIITDDDLNTAINQTRNIILTDYEWLKIHKQLQIKALAWEHNPKDDSRLIRGKELQEAERQLAVVGSNKIPQPTDLQRRFVEKSRLYQKSSVRKIALLVVSVVGVIVFLGILAAGYAILAQRRGVIATTESTARAQAQLSELARQLSTKAQYNYTTGFPKPTVTLLLAVQSMKLAPSLEVSQILQDRTLMPTLSHMDHDDPEGPIGFIAFSHDSELVASSDGASVIIWDTHSGKEIARINEFCIFSPNGQYMAWTANSTIHVLETFTTEELIQINSGTDSNVVAITNDGKYVIAQGDNIVSVWDVNEGKQITSRRSNDYFHPFIAVSANGEYILSINDYFTSSIWETKTGTEVSTVETMNTLPPGVEFERSSFSPNGKFLIGLSSDETLHVWDSTSWHEIMPAALNNRVNSIAFTQDSNYLVTGSDDHTARVWKLATGKETARILHESSVISVAVSPNGKYGVSATDNGIAYVWDLKTGETIVSTVFDGGFDSLVFSRNGKYIASTSRNVARVWEINPKTELMQGTHDDRVTSVAFSPDGKYVVSGGEDGVAHILQVANGEEISSMTHDGKVMAVVFSPNGKYVASGGGDIVSLWETTSGKEIARMSHYSYVTSLAFSPNGQFLISGSDDTIARVWEVPTGREVASMAHDGRVTSVGFSPNSQYVVTGNLTNPSNTWSDEKVPTLHVWEAATGKEITSQYGDGVTSVAFSPDGNYVAAGSIGEYADILEVTNEDLDKNRLNTLMGDCPTKENARANFNDEVTSVDFSPNNKYLVAGSLDGTARVLDLSGNEITRLTQNTGIEFVVFSPDGKYVVSGNQNSARIWDVCTGSEIVSIVHQGKVTSAAFSPDGKYLVTGSEDKTVRVWLWQPQDLIATTCSRLTRNLTLAEWKQYIGNTLPFQAVCPNLPIEQESP